ncbi:MAG: TetR/AcrR family transcriptional regulator [Acidobacteriota bacterium]|nr:TetR/AcrR family transcriptional regulator [Acidobacteriota bacterium]
MHVKTKKALQSEKTRGEIVRVARKLFEAKGYAGTGTEEIVRRAGVTRGALYHQFRDKKALFVAVVEASEREMAGHIQAAVDAEAEPWARLEAGYLAVLDACTEPGIRQILLLDAPAVLGVERWRTVEAEYGLGLLSRGLEAIMKAERMKPLPVRAMAHLLLGAISEGALMIASAGDPGKAHREVVAGLQRLLGSLKRTDAT